MPHYLLGIDLGTSGVRAGVYHEDGTCLATAALSYPIETPIYGRAEQDPEVWWKSTCESIREALAAVKLKGNDITGISFSGQMHGTVLLDSEGISVVPAVIWADSRSTDECSEIEKLIGNERLEKIIMNRIFPGTQAATILWIQRNENRVWQKVRRVLTPKDYLRYRMCGLFNTEPSDASGTLLFDVSLREWSQEILNTLGISIELLPFVVNSDQCIGVTENMEEESGIPDGVPVVMGGGDQPCAALGNGVIEEGTLLVTIGTGGQLFTPSQYPRLSPGLALNTFCHLPGSRWYVMGATLSAGMCLQWFRNTFCPGADFDTLTLEASSIPPGTGGLMFTPHLAGKRSPDLNPSAAGIFSGIRNNHTRGHFIRAIMEGVVFDLRENLDVMTGMGLVPKTVICSGGAVKSPLWLQIVADIFNKHVSVSRQEQAACFGAALIAGIGTGIYGSWHDTVKVVKSPENAVEPITENTRIYEDLFAVFKKQYHAMGYI